MRSDILKPLLKIISDPVEKCRELGLELLSSFVKNVLDDLGFLAPSFFLTSSFFLQGIFTLIVISILIVVHSFSEPSACLASMPSTASWHSLAKPKQACDLPPVQPQPRLFRPSAPQPNLHLQ